MNEQIFFKSKITQSKFEEFLLKLDKPTLKKFTKFENINLKTVSKIVSDELNNPNIIKFFTFINHELIAYSFLRKFEKKSKKHNCVLGIVMLKKWQNKGHGKKICQHMIKSAWKKKFEKIWLTVYSDNIHAYRLYKKLGFEIEGIFLNDEKIWNKNKHKISMAIFKNKNSSMIKRKRILQNLKE